MVRHHNRLNALAIGDEVALVAPLGLLFGRLANFINGELYGRVTNHPLGMVFPGGGPLPRHPSQLYEAFFEGFVLLCVGWAVPLAGSKKTEPWLNNKLFSGRLWSSPVWY